MNKELLKKLCKCDPLELLYWIASCEHETSDKEYAIEYAMNCVLSLKYRKGKTKRKVTRELVQRTLEEALIDFSKIRDAFMTSKPDLRTFSFPFLMIRGEGFPWQLEQASLERYGAHDDWMLTKLGFTIGDAVYFSKAITKMLFGKKLPSLV